MTKNKDVKPKFTQGISEEQQQGLNVVEFTKYDEVLSASYEVLKSINVRGYALKVSWVDLILMRKALKDRVVQIVAYTLPMKGRVAGGVVEVWCKFLGFRFSIRHYY